MATDSRLRKLTEENRRLAAELAEARDILRALRSGEVDALVSSGSDAVYAVQLIALAVDQAETYAESLTLLLVRLCRATGWAYAEAWASSENRRALLRTPAWFGANSDAIRLREAIAGASRNPAEDAMDRALRSGKPQWIALGDLNGGDYTEALARSGLRSGLAYPLVAAGKVSAVLMLWREQRDGDGDVVLQQVRRILQEAAPFVERKRDEEARRHTLEALKGMVHERSRRLAELSGQIEEQSQRREQAETLSRNHQEASQRSQRALEQQGALLQSVLDSMADGVIVTDLSGRVLQSNFAAQKIFGNLSGDVPWRQWPEVYGLYRPGTLGFLAAEESPLPLAARGETCDRVEVFVKNRERPEGRTISLSARPLAGGDEAPYGVVAVFQDITQHKRDEARRLQRVVEQRDALVREVHHRIKNNLAGLVALLQQHTARHPESKEINTRLEAKLYAVASMHGLEAVGNGGITLGSLMKSLSENTQSLFGRTVKVDCGEAERLGNLQLREAESVPLALALNELLVNAHKHGTAGPVQIRALREGKGLVIEVENKVEPGATLPDLEALSDNGSGLGLVRALLPHEDASLELERSGNRVSAIVRLPAAVLEAAG